LLKTIDEPPSGNARGRIGAINGTHGDDEALGRIFGDDLDE
jgi:hypothetical protein